MVEHGSVKRVFVLKVVVEESFIDVSGAGNGVNAGASQAFAGNLLHCGAQNGGAALLGAAPGAEARFGVDGFHKNTLINQLVRL